MVVQVGAVQPLPGELFVRGGIACPGAAIGLVLEFNLIPEVLLPLRIYNCHATPTM